MRYRGIYLTGSATISFFRRLGRVAQVIAPPFYGLCDPARQIVTRSPTYFVDKSVGVRPRTVES
jgi:hypothetical protein